MKRLLPLLLVLVLGLAACGDSASDDPEASLVDALEALADYEGVTATVTLATDDESMDALIQAGEGELSPELATTIRDSSLTISSKGDDPENAQGFFLVNIGGSNALELRFIGPTLFARIDAPALAETFGQDPAQLDALAQQASAAGITFAEPAIAGEWIELTGLEEFQRQVGMQGAQQQAEAEKAFRQLADSIEADAEVTAGDREGPGDHLVAVLSLRDAYENFREAYSGLLAQVPGTAFPPAEQVPDQDFMLDTWVEDGALAQIEFDFLQIARISDEDVPEGVERLALRITFEEFTDDVETPGDTVRVNFQELFGMFMGGMAGSAGSQSVPPPGEFDCSFLEGQPREVLIQFKNECPELLKK